MKSRTIALTAGLLALSALALPAAALAQNPTTITGTTTAAAKFETKAKGRGDQEIDRRVANLSQALTRIGEMKKVTDADKSALQGTISAQVSDLNTLKAKIDADTVLADLKTDVQSITKSYRVYALLLPEIHIIAASDRVVAIASDMATLEGKLTLRMASSTADVTVFTALDTDLKAKVVDANTQAQAAVNEVIALQPDNGDATVAKKNRDTLKDAQSKLQTAAKDLAAARADIGKMLGLLKGAGAGLQSQGNASTSAATR